LRRVARKPQDRGTVSTKIFSSGECTEVMLGPNEIMSISGYFSPMRPHSRPAWTALTSGSLPWSERYVATALFGTRESMFGFQPG